MCIVIVNFPVFDIINFEINLFFLIRPFVYLGKKSREAFKYIENKWSYKVRQKSIFINFKELSVVKKIFSIVPY